MTCWKRTVPANNLHLELWTLPATLARRVLQREMRMVSHLAGRNDSHRTADRTTSITIRGPQLGLSPVTQTRHLLRLATVSVLFQPAGRCALHRQREFTLWIIPRKQPHGMILDLYAVVDFRYCYIILTWHNSCIAFNTWPERTSVQAWLPQEIDIFP